MVVVIKQNGLSSQSKSYLAKDEILIADIAWIINTWSLITFQMVNKSRKPCLKRENDLLGTSQKIIEDAAKMLLPPRIQSKLKNVKIDFLNF